MTLCSFSYFLITAKPAYLVHPSEEHMSNLAKQLGKRIYLFRKQNDLTQAALAEKARISNEFMSGLERGAKMPSLATLDRIATALRVDLKDLFNFDQKSFRKVASLSREGMDTAALLQGLSTPNRRRVLRILKVLLESLRD